MSKHKEPAESNDAQLKNRRDFLKRLGKWSTIIIGSVALGGMVAPDDGAGWVNGGGGGWVNARGGGGGGGWVNRSGGGAWVNGGRAWVNGGGSWVNRSGGSSGGSWVNRRGY
jgi:hypothetical protein